MNAPATCQCKPNDSNFNNTDIRLQFNGKFDISHFKPLPLRLMVKIGDSFLRRLEKPLILCLLLHKLRHGYELRTEFQRLTGKKLKPSIVYPFLHRLEREGFANSHWMIKGKRKIKHYTLTKSGEELFKRVKETFTKPVKEFFLEIIGEKQII